MQHSSPKEGQCQRMFKLPYSCIHMLAKVMLKNPSSKFLTVHETRISRCTSQVSKSQRNQRSNCQHVWIEKARGFQKGIYFCFIDCAKVFDCVSQQTVENSSRDGNTRPPYLPPGKPTQVKKQQLELYMGQWTGSKLGKKYVKAVFCHPACLTYMQSPSCKMLGWMKHKQESRLLGEISTTSNMQITPP